MTPFHLDLLLILNKRQKTKKEKKKRQWPYIATTHRSRCFYKHKAKLTRVNLISLRKRWESHRIRTCAIADPIINDTGRPGCSQKPAARENFWCDWLH